MSHKNNCLIECSYLVIEKFIESTKRLEASLSLSNIIYLYHLLLSRLEHTISIIAEKAKNLP